MTKKKNKKRSVKEDTPTDEILEDTSEDTEESDDLDEEPKKQNKLITFFKNRFHRILIKLSLLVNILIVIIFGSTAAYSIVTYIGLDPTYIDISTYLGMFISPFLYTGIVLLVLVPMIMEIRYLLPKSNKEMSIRALLISSITSIVVYVGIGALIIAFGFKEGSSNMLGFSLMIAGLAIPQLVSSITSILYLKTKRY